MNRSIVFLSDFGYRNEWGGICHAVIDKIAPESHVIDLSHGVPPLDVGAAALLLADSLPFVRHDAVVLAVVDPSVGRDRDLAVQTGDGRLLVGPDNGLLAPAWRASEGVARAVSMTSSSVVHEPVAPSFHARDVLAPRRLISRSVCRSKRSVTRSIRSRSPRSESPSRRWSPERSRARSWTSIASETSS